LVENITPDMTPQYRISIDITLLKYLSKVLLDASVKKKNKTRGSPEPVSLI
jgi:hypothetical protein